MLLKLALAVLIPAYVAAQSLKPYNLTATALFYVSDANKDGILDLQEIDSNFRTYDRDNDGRITRYEYTSYVDQNSPNLHAFSHALYDIYDVDGDDYLDLHDFENFFKLIDSNGDGIIIRTEYVRYFEIILESLEHLHGGRNGKKNVTK